MRCTTGLTEQEHKPAQKNDNNNECNKHTFLSLIQSPPSVFSSSISFSGIFTTHSRSVRCICS
ncbi:hypothetical protein, partial [Escherichia coli]|uniref:hypothetical protein n=2 Tax=Escherichia coli TaxID=562 RepID=UPI001C4FAFCF